MAKILRTLILILIVIAVLFALLIGVLTIIGHVRYDDSFFKEARREFAIPGIHEGYIPQGISYDEASEKFLACGYFAKDEASRIYVIDPRSGDEKFVRACRTDGEESFSHAGGLTVYRDFLYFADGDHILVYELSAVLEAENGAKVKAIGRIAANCNAAYLNVSDGVLYVGEFYRAGNYETDASHHFKTGTGDENRAVILAYRLSPDAELGLSAGTPDFAYSVTNQIQGMCVTDTGRICLSESWGPSTSHIYIYELSGDKSDTTMTVAGKEIPVTYLDSSNLKETVNAAPMLEEIVYVNGRIYTMYESASNKYIFGKFFRETHSWSIERK